MKDETKLIISGRPHRRPQRLVNPPVERASTILFTSYDDFLEGAAQSIYGRQGTATHRALEEAVSVLEGANETRLLSSGLQACVAALLSFVEAGDHVLVVDSAYGPTRRFCDQFLKRFGVETSYYDPLIGAEIANLMRPSTKVIFAESPGSLTFEVQDLPALAKAAHDGGAKLVVDNTWSAGYYHKPLALGADVSIQAGTKYLSGHADCLIGAVSTRNESTARAINYTARLLGANVSADDAWLALRGMRSLSARLERHQETALKLARWLDKRPEIERVYHPALRNSPGHEHWKRDFTGSSGLFGALLRPVSETALKAFFNALRLFGMGFSWGGFESLCVHVRPEISRTARPWQETGALVRIHAGLEDVEDLKNDLERAFAVLMSAQKDPSSGRTGGTRA